jgi:hypothetical protein
MDATARGMAKKLTRGAPLAVQIVNQPMYRGLEQTIEADREAACYCLQLSKKTEDAQEGIVSFFEKGDPLERQIVSQLLHQNRDLSWRLAGFPGEQRDCFLMGSSTFEPA